MPPGCPPEEAKCVLCRRVSGGTPRTTVGKTIIFPHGRSRGAPCAKRTYRKNTASGVVRCPPGAPVPHRTCCKNTDSGAVRCPRGAPLKKESACFAVVLVGAPRERPWGVINIIRWNTPGVPPSQGRRSNGHESHHGTDGCPWFHGGTEKGMRWVHVVPRRE